MVETKTIFLVLAVLSGLLFLGSVIFANTAYKLNDGFGLPPPEEPERRKRRIVGLVMAMVSFLALMGFYVAYKFNSDPQLMELFEDNTQKPEPMYRPDIQSILETSVEHPRRFLRREMVNEIFSRLRMPFAGQFNDLSVDELRPFIIHYMPPGDRLETYESILDAITEVENAKTREELALLHAKRVARNSHFSWHSQHNR